MIETKQRQTAHHVWISQLLSGTFVKTTGEWDPNYVEIGTLKVSRVNLIAHVVDTFLNTETNYANITLDDGSARIPVKAWKDDLRIMEGLRIGDLVLVVGKIKDFNTKLFLSPEIIKKLDNPQWAKLRQLQLKKNNGEPLLIQTTPEEHSASEDTDGRITIVEEKVTNETPAADKRQKILHAIEDLDTNNGADQELVIHQSELKKEDAEKILETLIKEGEVFEIHPGKLRTTL